MSTNLTFSTVSEKGLRDNNEDLCQVEPLLNDKYLLALVCDGVGGENAGEVAAYIAKKTFKDYLSRYQEISLEIFRMGVIAANNAIVEQQINPRYERMGTCMSVCVLSPETEKLFICHVGYTRIFSYSKASNEITKLTLDHSYVGKMYDERLITEQQAMNHPKRNRISLCLGSHPLSYFDDYVYSVEISLKDIDRLILISDGVSDVVKFMEMKNLLADIQSPEPAATSLVETALEHGSQDNISAIVINK